MGNSSKVHTSVSAPATGSHTETIDSYVKAISEYIERLRKTGRKIPESPTRKGCPYLTRIASEVGLPYYFLDRPSVVRDRLNEGIAEIGMSVFERGMDLEVITYELLFETGSQRRAEELKGKSSSEQQLSNTRWALRKFMRKIDAEGVRELDMSEVVGPEFQELFPERKRLIEASTANTRTRRKFSNEIDWWQQYYRQLANESKLPPDFPSAFKLVVERSGITIWALAELANVHHTLIQQWRDGTKTPSQQSFPAIERIEEVLGLQPKCLIMRINRSGSKRFRLTDYPEYITVNGESIAVRSNRTVLKKIRRLLPDDFDKRTEKEREEVTSWIYSNLLEPGTAWRRSQRFAVRADAQFLMPELPPIVKEEWQDLSAFKSGKLPPPGMERSGTWSSQTELLQYNSLTAILSPFTLPAEQDDPRVCGLGLSPDLLTLAMLTCPKVLHWRTCWMGRRRYENFRLGTPKERQDDKEIENDDESVEMYSFRDSNLIKDWGGLLAPETGWLRQRPDLAYHLKPIPGFIDESFIKRAKKEWGKLCDEAYAYYINFAVTIEEVAEELRDSFEPIMPILESENPMAALRMFAQNILDDKPEPLSSPFRVAKHMRNYLIVRLLSATALRSKNMRELTYREDNTGHLRRDGGKWVIEIPYKRFKNWQSPFFGTKKNRENYRKVLTDADGLYEHIEEYVKVYRLRLLQGTSSDIMIVSSAEKPLYAASPFGALYFRLTMLYLAHNPYRGYGIPGVIPHGPHSVRDIVATHVIKKTGSYDMAGHAIQDTGDTARKYYARFMPKDKVRMSDKVLDDGYLSEF